MQDLINSNNKIISDFIKKFLYDFFSISDFSISFFNLKNITNVQVFNQSLKSNDILKKKIFFIVNQKNLDIIVKLKKKVVVKKMCFF